jgi:hypothetical protein
MVWQLPWCAIVHNGQIPSGSGRFVELAALKPSIYTHRRGVTSSSSHWHHTSDKNSDRRQSELHVCVIPLIRFDPAAHRNVGTLQPAAIQWPHPVCHRGNLAVLI